MEIRTKLQILVRPAGQEETSLKNVKMNEQLAQWADMGTSLNLACLRSRSERNGAEA